MFSSIFSEFEVSTISLVVGTMSLSSTQSTVISFGTSFISSNTNSITPSELNLIQSSPIIATKSS